MAKSRTSAADKSESTDGKSRFVTAVATVAFVVVVGSCCICGGLAYQQFPTFQSDRAAALAVTREILPVTVPAVFDPEGTIEWKIWMMLRMKGAYFTHSIADGELSFLQVDSEFIDNDEFREHIIQSLREHGAGGGFDLLVRSAETKAYEIDGETYEFNFLEAEDRTTGNDRRLVDGVVNVGSKPVMISLWVDEEQWDPKMFDDLIASIGKEVAPPVPAEP